MLPWRKISSTSCIGTLAQEQGRNRVAQVIEAHAAGLRCRRLHSAAVRRAGTEIAIRVPFLVRLLARKRLGHEVVEILAALGALRTHLPRVISDSEQDFGWTKQQRPPKAESPLRQRVTSRMRPSTFVQPSPFSIARSIAVNAAAAALPFVLYEPATPASRSVAPAF